MCLVRLRLDVEATCDADMGRGGIRPRTAHLCTGLRAECWSGWPRNLVSGYSTSAAAMAN